MFITLALGSLRATVVEVDLHDYKVTVKAYEVKVVVKIR